jgi:hypothetical protein
MRNNHQRLTDVGQKAKTSTGWFADTEQQNIEEVSRISDA